MTGARHRAVDTPPRGLVIACRRRARARACREFRDQLLTSLGTGAGMALFLATFGVL